MASAGRADEGGDAAINGGGTPVNGGGKLPSCLSGTD